MQIHELNERKKVPRKPKADVDRTPSGAAAVNVRDLPAHVQQQIAQKMQPDTGRPNPYMTPAANTPPPPPANFGGTQGYGKTTTNAPSAIPTTNNAVPTNMASTAKLSAPAPSAQKVNPQSWAGQNINVPAAIRRQQAQQAQQPAPTPQPTQPAPATPAPTQPAPTTPAPTQPTSVAGQKPTLAQRALGFVSSAQQGANRRYDRANPNNNAWADIPGSVGDAQKTSQARAQKLMKLASPGTQQQIAAMQQGSTQAPSAQQPTQPISSSPQSVLSAISPTQLTRRNLQAAGQILQQGSNGNKTVNSTGNPQVDTMLKLMGFTVI